MRSGATLWGAACRRSAAVRITSVKMVEIAGGFEMAISHAACGGICIKGLSVRGSSQFGHAVDLHVTMLELLFLGER